MLFDPERLPSFNPFSALVATGALMFATVVVSESGPGIDLAREGAKALDRDVTGLVARASASVQQFAAVHFGPSRRSNEDRTAVAPQAEPGKG
jgi:hypothetical protein